MSEYTERSSLSVLTPIHTLFSRQRTWATWAVGFSALTIITLLLATVDTRELYGVSVWTKPTKFNLSLAVYFATLAWFANLMPSGYFTTLRGRVLVWAPVICAALEIAYVLFQAGLGEPSHFNTSTPFHAAAYSLMGFGAVVLVAICLWMGISILRHHGVDNPYILAVGLGLILTCLLGGAFGMYLGNQGGHWVGGAASDAGGLPIVKWVRDGGDLRVAHFFGMHAMQLIPLAVWPLRHRRSALAFAVVVGVCCAYAAYTTMTFVQAVNGQPYLG